MVGPVGIESFVGPPPSGGGLITSPTQIGTVSAWYDANEITGLSDTDPVAQWDDLSGNERHLLQADGTRQPLYRTDVLSGRPSVRFDGINDYLQVVFGETLSQPNTICAMGRNLNGDVFHDGIVSNRRHLFYTLSGNWNLFAGNTLVAGTADTDYHTFCSIFNGGSSALWIDNALNGQGNTSSQALTGLTLGSSQGIGTHMSGDILELILFPFALTDEQVNEVNHYFFNQYGFFA